jgi:hypothetical protein
MHDQEIDRLRRELAHERAAAETWRQRFQEQVDARRELEQLLKSSIDNFDRITRIIRER